MIVIDECVFELFATEEPRLHLDVPQMHFEPMAADQRLYWREGVVPI